MELVIDVSADGFEVVEVFFFVECFWECFGEVFVDFGVEVLEVDDVGVIDVSIDLFDVCVGVFFFFGDGEVISFDDFFDC